MPHWILHQFLDLLRLRAILPFADHPRFVSPLCKKTRSSLVAVGDADLEGVVVEPWDRGAGTIAEFLLENLE